MGFLVKKGDRWYYRFRSIRPSDGKRCESMRTIGSIADYPSEKKAREEVDRRKLHLLEGVKPRTFGELIDHYDLHELQSGRKEVSTVLRDRHNLCDYVSPRWGTCDPLEIEPLDVEQWLGSLKSECALSGGTLGKIKGAMRGVYRHAQRHGLLARDSGVNPIEFVRCESGSDFESVVLTPEQTVRVLGELEQPEYTIALLVASTGMRASEAFALRWGDLDWDNNLIHLRRTRVYTEVKSRAKTKASMEDMPLHPVLAEALKAWRMETLYSMDSDWVFASIKSKGRIPRTPGIAAQDYLRPAAVRAGVLRVEKSEKAGRLIETYTTETGQPVLKFGWHCLRHSLATYLVAAGTDPKTVQSLLRHSNVKTTLQIYTHANADNKMAAQGAYLHTLQLLRGGTEAQKNTTGEVA